MRRWFEVASSVFLLTCALLALGIWSLYNGGMDSPSRPSSVPWIEAVPSALSKVEPPTTQISLPPSSFPTSQGAIRYSTFGRYIPFEPSSITRIGYEPFFLVVDDKSKQTPFSIFELTASGHLSEVHRFHLSFGEKPLKLRKLEATTGAHRDKGLFYAMTAFDRPKPSYNRLVRFRLQAERDKKGNRRWSAHEVKALPIFSPTRWAADHLQQPWSKAEALALSPEEDSLIVGLRASGPHYSQPNYHVILLRYDLARLDAPPTLLAKIDLQGIVGRSEGISALRYVPLRRQYLLTTSYEDDSRSPATAQVGGHLWLVDADLRLAASPERWRSYYRIPLAHKPEGVDALGSSKAIVVYDDDGDRKSRDGDKGKFHLAPNEASFSILPLPPTP